VGGWGLLGAYLAGWIALLAARFARRRILVLPLGGSYPAHLLLAAAILADAAVFPGRGIAPPLGAALLMGVLSLALRDVWLVVGRRQQTALDVLEHLCRDRGVDVCRDGDALILKRLGTGVRKSEAGPGLGLVRLDRRRREREVDRLAREWGELLAGPRRRP
jgi:hypothetical protein